MYTLYEEEFTELEEEQSIEELPEDDNVEDDLLDSDLGFDDVGLGSGTAPMEKHNDLLKELTNFKPFLKELFKEWLGLKWSDQLKAYERDESVDPIMNVRCAKRCLSILRTYTRNNNIITNVDKTDYTHIMMDVIEEVWLNLGTRMEEFEIKSNGDVLIIANQMEHATKLILMGAGDGKYNDLLKESVQRTESVHLSDPRSSGFEEKPKKQGFLRTLFGGM